jgi:hypothetical protein
VVGVAAGVPPSAVGGGVAVGVEVTGVMGTGVGDGGCTGGTISQVFIGSIVKLPIVYSLLLSGTFT